MKDLSIESMYMNMGLSQNNILTSKEKGIENYDEDSGVYEIAKDKILINSMELYSELVELNNIQKMKLAERINKNYGIYSRSLENYCEKLIYSTENKEGDKPKEEKKQNFFKMIFHKIKDFLYKIGETIYKSCLRIFNKIRRKLNLKTKEEKEFEAKIEKEQKRVMEAIERFKATISAIEEHYLKPMAEDIGKLGDISDNIKSDKKRKIFRILIKECKCLTSYYTLLFKSTIIISDTVSQHYKLVIEKYEEDEVIDGHGSFLYFYDGVDIGKIDDVKHTLANAIMKVDNCIEDIIDYTDDISKEKNPNKIREYENDINEKLRDSVKKSAKAISELVSNHNIEFNFDIFNENDINQCCDKLDEIIKTLDDKKDDMDQFIYETFGLTKDKVKL